MMYEALPTRTAAQPRTENEEGQAQKRLVQGGGDEAGVMDQAEKRRLQNRRNQRAWRRRKALKASEAALAAADKGSRSSGFWVLRPMSPLERPPARAAAVDGQTDARKPARGPVVIPPVLPYVGQRSSSAATISTAGSTHGGAWPVPLLAFPLSLDHRLITLIQYNVLRATVTNMAILRILHAMPPECGLDALVADMGPAIRPWLTTTVPPSLQPTALQRATPHALWIDSCPSPALRDALIRHAGAFDEDDFCCDLMGGLYEGFDDVERRGLIVWTDPWCDDGWEVTEGFARKWTFLLPGCDGLLASTNRWRALRGEEPLTVEWNGIEMGGGVGRGRETKSWDQLIERHDGGENTHLTSASRIPDWTAVELGTDVD